MTKEKFQAQKKMFLFIFILSTVILFADTVIQPGDVSGSWTEVNSPYLIEGEITIPDGETLSIEPGVLVEFQGHYKFHVQGRLLAIGTIYDNIVFTINDTTGFYNIDLQEGAWQGIRFNNTPATNDSSKIVYCKIEYGKANGYSSSSGSGGGLYVENFSKLLIQNCEIYHNMALMGGGIALDDSDGVIIQNTLISANESSTSGGGMNLIQSNPILDDVVLQDNNAGRGGGIACWYDSSPIITYSEFINNNVVVHGGGIFCNYDSNPILTNVVFKQNTASSGGAMNFQNGSTPIIVRALITDNHASSSGAFSCGYDSNAKIINSTIYNNTATIGSVSYIYDSHPVFVNTIIWNNTPEAFYISDWDEYSNSITCAYSDVEGGEGAIINPEYATINWLDGNIDTDPLLTDPNNNDFTLSSDSPCIDAGTDFFVWNNETLIDMDSYEYFGIAPDIGAYEYESTDVSDEIVVSNKIMTLSNYPNPFNPATTISFSITESTENMELIIYNLKGQRVKLIPINQFTNSPVHHVIWNGTDDNKKPVSSGIYFYKLRAGKFEKVNKMILMK